MKQKPLSNRAGNGISQIAEFGFVASKLITAIYKSGWGKLMAKNNSML